MNNNKYPLTFYMEPDSDFPWYIKNISYDRVTRTIDKDGKESWDIDLS